KPPGTETPRRARLPIISPSEEFLPPTCARSVRRRSSSHRMLALKADSGGICGGAVGKACPGLRRRAAGLAILASQPAAAPAASKEKTHVEPAPGLLRLGRHRNHRRNRRP